MLVHQLSHTAGSRPISEIDGWKDRHQDENMGEYASVTSVRLYLGGCLELSCAFRTVSLTKKEKVCERFVVRTSPTFLFFFPSTPSYEGIAQQEQMKLNAVKGRLRVEAQHASALLLLCICSIVFYFESRAPITCKLSFTVSLLVVKASYVYLGIANGVPDICLQKR